MRHGDGFFGAGSTTTARFAEQVPIARQTLEDAGRDANTFRIAKRVYISIDDNVERARQRASDGLERFYAGTGLRNIVDVAVYGRPSVCVEGVRKVVEAGAELVLFTPFFDKGDQLERLAHEVIPQFEKVGVR